jgi:hypothetical protein
MRLSDYFDLRDRSRLLLVAAAVTFAGLFLIGLVGFTLAGLASYPSPLTATTEEIERYFRDGRDAVRVNALVQLAATVPLVVYGALAATRLRATGDRTAAPVVVAASATLSGACLALSAVTQWAMSRPHTLENGGTLLRALQDLAFAAGGPAHVLFLGVLVAGVCLAARPRHLPTWITGLGAAAATLSGLSVLTLVFDRAAWVLPVARFPTFVWLLMAAIALPGATAADHRPDVVNAQRHFVDNVESRPVPRTLVDAGRSGSGSR